ncbi:hypothetical protein GCM10010916_36240 [Paenibacillus abyssi]|uniref:Uncharacterized protein n=1 Tax=Paenibacillus abyssi TaxID=1340531 RepID=A0A917LE27_9BACL|nr:hypothetical protein GCM10010916_36240 [Paenibacillus abyssi]
MGNLKDGDMRIDMKGGAGKGASFKIKIHRGNNNDAVLKRTTDKIKSVKRNCFILETLINN